MSNEDWRFYEESWNEENWKEISTSKRNRRQPKKLKKVRRQKENNNDKSSSKKWKTRPSD